MRARAERLTLRTRDQFVISRTAYRAHENVFVEVQADDGVLGWGEAAPNAYYGESQESALAALERLQGLFAELSALSLDDAECVLAEQAPRDTSVRAAVSAALHDAWGKRQGAPVHRLWGLDPAAAPLSSYTIAISAKDVLRERVSRAAEFPILKVKLGTDHDVEIVTVVSEAAPGKRLLVDANAAWTREHAVRMAHKLAAFGVELIEQPVARDDVDGLAFVRERSPLPIFADESCHTARDVARLTGAVDGVNIKLAKCGGLAAALKLASAARAAGMSIMGGCMIESSLGISAIAQLAPLFDYADLDGAALLADDPFDGVRMEAGRLDYPDRPGLGVVARAHA